LQKQSEDPGIWSDQKAANALFADLRSLKKTWEPVSTMLAEVNDLLELTAQAALGDLADLEKEYAKLETQWKSVETQLYLSGEYDAGNCYITISGGAGGTEAQDWAAMLLRMYLRYCERQGWKTDLVDKTDGQEAGIKTATIYIEGSMAYGYLKCERGTHRLVRLSPFNAKSLRQTSFALVEVLPEIEETEVAINQSDLRVDTFRSGGAGGQNVNIHSSRIAHAP
ncbi:MAG: peptide chain release factor 2, partial [Candidatus Peregrinibacteria bacterium Greene1014_49]